MPWNNSLDNGVKEARTNNGEGLSPRGFTVGEQHSPGPHQDTCRKKKTINLQSLVTLKQKNKVKGDIENECTNTR